MIIFAKLLFIKPLLFIYVYLEVNCDWADLDLLPDRHVLEVPVHISTDSATLLLRMELLSLVS